MSVYYPLYEMDGQKDILGNAWKIDINRDSIPPTTLEIEMGAGPVKISTMVQKQDVFGTRIIGHEISLVETDSQSFNGLRDSLSQTEYQIETNVNGDIVKTFMDNDGYSEPYKANPKIIYFKGYEGFHILKTKEVKNYDGQYFDGFVSIKNIIVACIKQLEISGQKVNLACNLFETNHSGGSDPLSQTYIESDSFWEDNSIINCTEILKRIMGTFGLAFFMADDDIWFIRIAEMYKTSVTYYQYSTSSGGFIKTDTFNPRIVLADSESRTARKDWINANMTLSIKKGVKEIKVTSVQNLKETFWEYARFRNFTDYDIAGITFNLPDGWSTLGSYTRVEKQTPFYINGKTFYSIKIDGAGLSGIKTDPINLKIGANVATPSMRVKITLVYKIDYNGQANENISMSIRERIVLNKGTTPYQYYYDQDKFINTSVTYTRWTEDVHPSPEFGTLTTEFTIIVSEGTQSLEYYLYKAIGQREDGSTYPSWEDENGDEQNGYGGYLIVKEIKMEAFYYNNDTDEYEEIPDSMTVEKINSKNRGTFEKEMYYTDYDVGSENASYEVGEETVRKLMLNNLLYYQSGGEYYPTSEWDYDSKGINGTLREVMLYDLQFQYGTPCHIINGDLMGAYFKNYNIFQDSKDGNRLFLPLTTVHDLKYAKLSGEFMELKSSETESGDYLADENGDAILDDQGNEILVNF